MNAPLTGYVEVMTQTAALGWAWVPGSAEKLTIALRHGDRIVAETIADQPRDDLARGGIGDGEHAFSLTVPEILRDQLSELRVVARGPDGTEVVLNTPPADEGIAEHLSRLTRGMDAIIASQRVMHRNLQAALLNPPESGTADIAATQATLRDSIATMELFVARLELRAPAPDEVPVRTGVPHWAAAGTAAMAGLALVLSVWALTATLVTS